MNQKCDKKENKIKDRNKENKNENEFHSLFFLFTFTLYLFCIFFVYIHFVFSLFTFILCFLCLHSLCVFSFYIHFVCFLFINVLTSFSFWFLTWASENVSSIASILIRLSSHRWVIYCCDKYWSWYDYNEHGLEKDITSNCKISMKWASQKELKEMIDWTSEIR